MAKSTPLLEIHKKLGAEMTEFGGWNMPFQYTSIMDEHIATRTAAGLFDICHMGEIEISGEKALDFVQKIITNDASKLKIGDALYSCMCYENGGTVDDLCVFKLAEDRYMIVVNAANTGKDYNWMAKNRIEGAEITDVSDSTAKLDIQGPKAEKILQKVTDIDLSRIKRFTFVRANVGGIKTFVSRTGYTAEFGFELIFDRRLAVKMWNALLAEGKADGLKPIGLGARGTLRTEACYSLYGHELNDVITPVEAGLGWVVKEDKPDFIGKEVLAKQKKEGTKRKMVAFEMVDKAIPREGYAIEKDGANVGHVTTGIYSPTFKKGLGMGFVAAEQAKVGNGIEIVVRDKRYRALIAKRPLYAYRGDVSGG